MKQKVPVYCKAIIAKKQAFLFLALWVIPLDNIYMEAPI